MKFLKFGSLLFLVALSHNTDDPENRRVAEKGAESGSSSDCQKGH
jgi:hypothetical protein